MGREVLLDLKRRGLKQDPKLAIHCPADDYAAICRISVMTLSVLATWPTASANLRACLGLTFAKGTFWRDSMRSRSR